MSEFEAEVKKAEKELEQGLARVNEPFDAEAGKDEFLGDLKMHAQEYGQKIQDTATKAYDFASEKFTQAGEVRLQPLPSSRRARSPQAIVDDESALEPIAPSIVSDPFNSPSAAEPEPAIVESAPCFAAFAPEISWFTRPIRASTAAAPPPRSDCDALS